MNVDETLKEALIAQLRLSDEAIVVPDLMKGIGPPPSYTDVSVQDKDRHYYILVSGQVNLDMVQRLVFLREVLKGRNESVNDLHLIAAGKSITVELRRLAEVVGVEYIQIPRELQVDRNFEEK